MVLGVDLGAAWQTVREMAQAFIARLPIFLVALLVLGLFVVAAVIARRIVIAAWGERRHANVAKVFARLTRAGLVLAGLLVATTIAFPSVDPGNLIALLGLGGVAIGFAFKDILQNFLAGLLILIQQPFKEGDQIVHAEHEGTVEEIQTRATYLKTYDGRRIVIPNAELYTNAVVVNTAYEKRRSEYDVGVTYDVSVDRAKTALLEAVRNVDGVLSDPAPEAMTVALAPSTMNIRVRWWTETEQAEVVHVSERVLSAIKEKMAVEGIDLPFPIRTVLLKHADEGTREEEEWAEEPTRRETRGGARATR